MKRVCPNCGNHAQVYRLGTSNHVRCRACNWRSWTAEDEQRARATSARMVSALNRYVSIFIVAVVMVPVLLIGRCALDASRQRTPRFHTDPSGTAGQQSAVNTRPRSKNPRATTALVDDPADAYALVFPTLDMICSFWAATAEVPASDQGAEDELEQRVGVKRIQGGTEVQVLGHASEWCAGWSFDTDYASIRSTGSDVSGYV